MNAGTYDDTFGGFIDNNKFITRNSNSTYIENAKLEEGRKRIGEAGINNVPKIEQAYEATTHSLITIYKYANSKKTVHQKLPRL